MTQENPPPTPPVTPPPLDYVQTVPPTKDETNMGILMFILAIVTGFIGPLIIWLIKKDSSKFIENQGKEVLNFQITVFLALLCNIPLYFILIGFLIMPVILITYVILNILGAISVSKGNAYRYPFALRLLK